MAWCRPEVFRAHLSWQEGKGEAESLILTSVMNWMFAHQSDGALALRAWGPRSPVPAKGCSQAFVDSTDQSVAASSCRPPTRRSSRLQDRRVARLSQVDSYCQAAPAGGPAAGRCPPRNTTETATGAIRALAVSLLAEPRNRGGENRTAAWQNDGRHCRDGAKSGGSVVPKPSLGRFPAALRGRTARPAVHAL